MIVSEQKLWLRDSRTLVEAEPSDDQTRPFEWRLSLNYLRFEATKFSVDLTHWINESDRLSRMVNDAVTDSSVASPLIRKALRSRISVSTKVSFDEIRDRIYNTQEFDQDKNLFTVSRETRAVYLACTISECDPINEDSGVFSSGAFYGSAGFYDDNSDELTLEITASKEVLSDLIKAISSGNLDKVLFNVVISSFSYEVDDALRDWHHSRDLLVNGFSTPAALESLVIRTRGDESPMGAPAKPVDDVEGLLDDDSKNSLASNREVLVRDVIVDTSELKSIKFALWFLLGVLCLYLFK